MKTTKYLGFLILLLSGLLFVQCTSDPIAGPPGMDGIDGIDGADGIDGIDGQDGTASCVACHNNAHRAPIEATYAVSKHANPGRLTGSSSCQKCHSNEGYINYIAGNDPITIDNPTAISCTTCHDKHSTFDFENDGHDYALRSLDPVSLMIDDTIVLDFENTSNNCLECHQPRRSHDTFYESNVQEDGTILVGNHFGPHYSNQSTMFYGIGGEYIPGSTDLPGIGTTTHYTGSSCVNCHMADGTDVEGKEGLHSWHTNENSCTSCHSGVPVMSDYQPLMDELEALLTARGLMDGDGGEVVGAAATALEHQALWNWFYVYDDHSKGVHNPAYTRALLKNSIEALQP